MVTQLRPAPHWTELLGQALGQGITGGFEGYGQAQEMKRIQQEKEDRRDFLKSKGFDPDIEQYPQGYQNAYYKSLFKEKPFWERALNRFSGTPNAQPGMVPGKPQQQMINIGGEQIPLEQLSPQTQQALQTQQQQQPSWLQSALGFGTGAAATLGQAALGFAPDIASLGLQGLSAISNPLFSDEDKAYATKNIEEKLANLDPNSDKAKDLKAQLEFFQNPPDIRNLLGGIEGVLPTTDRTIKAINAIADKAGLGEQFGQAPKSEFLGSIAGIFSNPASWKRGIGSIAKDALRAAGISLGGEAVNAIVSEATGSEKAGTVSQGLFYLLSSIYPGLMSSMAKGRYGQLDAIAQEAKETGKLVDMAPYKEEFNRLASKIEKEFTFGSPEYNRLSQDVNRLGSEIFSSNKVDPALLLNETQSMSSQWKKVPDQAKQAYQGLIDLQRKALGATLDQVKPGASKIMEEANQLWSAHAKANKQIRNLSSYVNYRNMGPGTLMLLVGGLKPVLAGAGGIALGKYANAMLKNPAVQKTMGQLAKASIAGNTAVVGKLMNKMNREGEHLLRKLPEKERVEVQKVIDEIKSGSAQR